MDPVRNKRIKKSSNSESQSSPVRIFNGVDKTMILKPRQSEKTYAMSQTGVYVFDVPKEVNKLQIASAVAAQFDVTVTKVRISILKGKDARSIRIGERGRSNVSGMRSNVKKAFVTLKDGDSIPVFAALDEQNAKIEAAEAKAEKKAKKSSTSAQTKGDK